MESSPLILGQDHARAASVATQSSEFTVAINEHTLAAGEFAKAASGTGSAEALRTLRLLERHHQRLSELLRPPLEEPPADTYGGELEVQASLEKPLSTSAAVAELRASKLSHGPRSSSPLRSSSTLQYTRRPPPRDSSSTIASTLASARGIRADYSRQPLSPSVSTQPAPGNFEVYKRRPSDVRQGSSEVSQPSWLPPAHHLAPKAHPQTGTSRESVGAGAAATTTSDEGFSRFYSTFESILTKLSAPLAFAGLPLSNDEEEEPATPDKDSASADKKASKNVEKRSLSDPDLTKYISRAALRTTAAASSANDSFYVVPPSGHTVSYAHILSFAEKEKHRLAASTHREVSDLSNDPDEDDFFDAEEIPGPVSPASSRPGLGGGGKRASGRNTEKKVEELDVENKSLKEVVDKLSKRLHAFELAAQNSTMALQESMRMVRADSPARESTGEINQLRRKLAELEDQVSRGGREMERLSRENEKLKDVVNRYRERWEKLKEGAKTRREAGKDGQGSKKDDPGLGRFAAG